MSDWEEDMYDDDEEEEELSFEDDSDDENVDVLMSNSDKMNAESLYFKAKHLKEEGQIDESIDTFCSIAKNELFTAEYKFKSLKQLLKISEQQNNIENVKLYLTSIFSMRKEIEDYYFSSSILKIVSRFNVQIDYSEFQLNYLNLLCNLSSNETNATFEKIKIKCDLLISQLYISLEDYERARDILTKLEHQISQVSTSTKNTYFLEIITSQILILLTYNFDLNELERLVMLTNSFDVGIPQMNIAGIKNEGSGMVSMYSGDYNNANCHFFDAFKNFNDSGDNRRVPVLAKYIVTSILSKSEVNPFQSSDFQGFLDIEMIDFLMKIFESVSCLDIQKFNELMKSDILKNLPTEFKFFIDFEPAIRELVYTEFITQHVHQFERIDFGYFIDTLEIDRSFFKKLLLKLHSTGKITGFRFDFVKEYITRCELPSIEIDAYTFIDNAFKLFDISNKKMKDIFKSEFEQLLHNDNTDSIERKTQSQINLRRYDGEENFNNEKMNELSFINLNQANMSLDKTILNENLDVLIFNTAYNTDSLRSLSKELSDASLIHKDLSKDTHIRNNIIDCINKFISIAQNSIPIQKENNLSYLSQIIDSKVTNEFNRLFTTNTVEADKLADSNIPDVICTSTMNQLDVPLNPDFQKDPDLSLSQKEKELKRLNLVSDSILLISKKQNESDIRFCNLKPSLQSTLSRTKLKRPASEMYRFNLDRFKSVGNTFDFSETTSTDNMSIDGIEEE